MHTVRQLGIIGLWTLQVLLAAAFVLIGVAKFGDAAWARSFARWGYPDGFYMVIGSLEMLGGLTLLVPRLASYGAAMLGVIMIAASLTHLVHGESNRVAAPLVYLAVLTVVAVARRRQALRAASMRAAAPEPGAM